MRKHVKNMSQPFALCATVLIVSIVANSEDSLRCCHVSSLRLKVMSMKNLSEQITSALRAAGEKGMLIDELAHSLDIDLETIAKAVKQLITEKQVMEKSEAENKARFFLGAAVGDETEQGIGGDLMGCPCYHCQKIAKCGIRQPDSPAACRDLENWMSSSESAKV